MTDVELLKRQRLRKLEGHVGDPEGGSEPCCVVVGELQGFAVVLRYCDIVIL